MECHEARQIIDNLIEDSTAFKDRSLDTHIKSCSKCASYLNELKRTWDILGAYPSIKPGPDFDERLHRKIAEPHCAPKRHPGWIPALSWQWAVAGACILVFGTFLTLR